MLKYQIIETKRSGQTQFVGRIKLISNIDQEGLLDRMVGRNTSLRRETIAAVLSLMKVTVADLCREGKSVRLDGLVRFCPTLRGTFVDQQDMFSRDRHEVSVTAGVAQSFQSQMKRGLSMHRVDSVVKGPHIFSVEDQETGTRNQNVTPGQIVSLVGQGLKFDPSDPRESLVFQNRDNPAEKFLIAKPVVVDNTELFFVMPKVPFFEGVFVLTSTMGTSKARSATSQPVRVVP